MEVKSEYDIIFAGGGTTGCLIAGRLAAANPDLSILIVEAGQHTLNDRDIIQPARYIIHQAPASTRVTFNVGKPSEHVNGRSIVSPSGRCLGGGSSVNFMMYTRAAASDYDDWEKEYKNPGWGAKDLTPLLRKTETYQVKAGESTHGYSGPLGVSYGGKFTNIGRQFLDVAQQYDKTRPLVEDPNDLSSSDGYGRWQKWINKDTGRRSDVPHHFIYTQPQNKNVHIVTGCRVDRVIFEGEKAVGVEYVNDTVVPGSMASTRVTTVRAKRLVVVSGGAFGSPTILERSGIGRATLLEKLEIAVKADLPGVGENYQDHNVVFVPYLASEDADTLDGLMRGNPGEEERWVKEWKETGQGLLAHNGIDGGAKLRPNEKELAELGPAFQETWKTYFADAPDKPVIWMGPVSMYLGDPTTAPNRKYYSVGYYTEYPVSRGRVHIKSKDPNALHDFEPGFLTETADRVVLRWGYKVSREFARRMGSYRGEYLPGHPVFSEGSSVKCSDMVGSPVSVDSTDFVYSAEDDERIDDYNRNFVQTAWHSLGTCAMMPREDGGVVDTRLNVYGVQGLKVADLSIAPGNVGANTYSTALVIGEKAAVIIAKELGLSL